MEMDRVDQILHHRLYINHLDKIGTAEKGRKYCRHDMSHFLDVARIARIINQEEALGFKTEWIYAAALLHDIGRHMQYQEGIPHEQAGAMIAPQILRDCDFREEETELITEAISRHRDAQTGTAGDFGALLYRADKASRACYSCSQEAGCNWNRKKKNLKIKY